jgi:hypothetical protein
MRLIGLPCMTDPTGSIWVWRVPLESNELLKVDCGRKVVQKIALPCLDSRMMLICDRPGSLYALTNVGLQHIVADAPAFDHYRVDKVYSIADVSGEIVGYDCSKEGNLLLSDRQNNSSSPFMLHSIRLPDK